MMRRFGQWLTSKWTRPDEKNLIAAYQIVFNTPHGRLLLNHWLAETYCTVCLEDNDLALARLNGKREFLHQLLENIEMAENPGKFQMTEDKQYG